MQLGRAVRSMGFRVAKENEEMKRVMRMKCVWHSGGDSYGVLLERRRFAVKMGLHHAALPWIDSPHLTCLNLIKTYSDAEL